MPVTTAALSAGSQAASSVINNVVTNLFNSGKIKAQTDQINLQTRLMQLSNSQQQALAIQLQQNTNLDDQLQILNNAAASIDVAGVTGNATILAAGVSNAAANNTAEAAIIIGSLVVLVVGLYFINKKSAS